MIGAMLRYLSRGLGCKDFADQEQQTPFTLHRKEEIDLGNGCQHACRLQLRYLLISVLGIYGFIEHSAILEDSVD